MIGRWRGITFLTMLGMAAGAAGAAWAAEPSAVATQPTTRPSTMAATQPVEEFLRFVDDGKDGGRLESEEVAYENNAGVKVRLVAAVHIGETSYYQSLQDEFANYDVVLYELIKLKGMPPPPPGGADSGVSNVQRFLKNALNLDFQLDVIDYTKPNFVNADLDWEKFQELQTQRGESFGALIWRQIVWSIANGQDDGEQMSLLDVLSKPDAERQIKVMLARQMGDLERKEAGVFTGPGGTVLVTERNKAAIAALRDSLSAGKKNIAIFYGAAHMPDLTDRLEAMGFKRKNSQWNMAWDLAIRPDRPSVLEQLMKKNAQQAPGGAGQ